MGHEDPPKPPIDLSEYKRRKKREERIKIRINDENTQKLNTSKITGERHAEQRYLEWRLRESKELWDEFERRIKKIEGIHLYEDMVEINGLKSLPEKDLIFKFLGSNPDDWHKKPLYFKELHRVIRERLNK